MAIENWIDAVVAVAGNVASHKGGKVRAYRVAMKGEIPEALSVFPCAVVYPTRALSLQYSMGGPCIEVWEVRGEFYLFPDNKKSNLPELVRYFARIRDATLASLTLGGIVEHFSFGEEPMSLVEMTYEVDSAPRHGIAVNWVVKSSVSGEVTIGA